MLLLICWCYKTVAVKIAIHVSFCTWLRFSRVRLFQSCIWTCPTLVVFAQLFFKAVVLNFAPISTVWPSSPILDISRLVHFSQPDGEMNWISLHFVLLFNYLWFPVKRNYLFVWLLVILSSSVNFLSSSLPILLLDCLTFPFWCVETLHFIVN